MAVEFISETARVLTEKGRGHDFVHIADRSTEILQGNLILKKFMLRKIIGKCDRKPELCAGMLKCYLEFEKLLNNPVEKKVRLHILIRIATGYLQTSNYRKTIKHMLKAENIADELNEKSAKVMCCRNLGSAYLSLAEYKEAIEYYNKGQAVSAEIGDQLELARNYGGLGNTYLYLMEYKKAIEYCSKGLAISTEIQDRSGIARNNGNLGNAYLNMGQYEKAIEYYNKSLAINTEIRDRSGIASNNMNLGRTYSNMSQYEKAIYYHNIALAICTEIGDRSGIGRNSENLGNAYSSMGLYEKAIDYYKKGLTISTETGDRSGIASSNGNLGEAYFNMCQYEKAIEYCNRGLAISTEIGDRSGMASNSENLGNVYYSMGQYEEAIEFYNKSLAISTEIENWPKIAGTNANLGNAYLNMGQFENAIEYYNEDLTISTQIGDRSGIAINIESLGKACLGMGQYEKAIEYNKQGLAMSTEIGDRSRIASNNGNLGSAYRNLGQYEKAIEHSNKGLAISTEIGNQLGIASHNGILGSAYFSMGQYEKAIEYYNKGLAISTEIGDRPGIASKNGNLGNAYGVLGKYKEAIECYNKGLTVSTEIGDLPRIASNSGNLGNVFLGMGQYEKAIEYYIKGLAISTEIGDRSGVASENTNLGNAYCSLGEYEKAIEYYKKGIEIFIEIGNRSGISLNVGNLGNAYYRLRKYENCIKYYNKSLAISTEIGDRSGIARNHGNVGNCHLHMGQYEKAIEYYNKGLAISIDIGDQSGIAVTNGNLGNAYRDLGEYEKALESFQRSLKISVEIGDRRLESAFLGNIGSSWLLLCGITSCKTEAFSKLQLAVSFLKRSVECSDEIFFDLSVDENKVSFTSEYFIWYLALVQCFIVLQRSEAALLVIDLGKAKALHASIEKRKKSNVVAMADYARKTWQVIDAKKEKDQISDIAKTIQHAKNSSTVLFYSFDGTTFLNIWVMNGGGDIIHISFKDFDGSLSAEDYIYQNVSNFHSTLNLTLNRSSSFFHGVGSNSTPGMMKVEDILRGRQPLTDKSLDAVELSKMFCFLNSESSLLPESKLCNSNLQQKRSVRSQMTMQTLEKVVQNYDLAVNIAKMKSPYKQLQYLDISMLRIKAGGCCLEVLRKLFMSLIYPIKKFIKGTKLIIVPDKFLFFVPFSLLFDEDCSYLSENYSIQITPSLHTLYSSMLVTEHASLGPALFVGNPTVGKFSFRKCEYDLPRLPSATKEVTFLASLFDTKPLVEHEATKSRVLKHIPDSSIIHIAAHGDKIRGEIFLAPNPEWKQQGFALPNENFYLLKEKDIIEIDIKACLVVLCCCHTGRGKISSEGVIGLARAFLAAGARSVLATLWPIDDECTKLFMENFYDEITKEVSVCEALKTTMNVFQRHKNWDYRSVKIWAPFTIFGEDVRFSREDIEEIKRKSREVTL